MKHMKDRLLKWIKEGKVQALFSILLLLYTYLPLLRLGMFNHSNSDDFWMSVNVHHAYVETGSFFSAVAAGFHNAVWIWKSWDGCFLSMFLTMLSPVAFHEDLYCLVYPFISLSFLFGTAVFTYVLLCRVLKMDWNRIVAVFCAFLVLVFQFVPYYGEAFYWWPGAVNYTFFFGMMLFSQGMAALYLYEKNKKALIWCCISGFCIGMGNLMTALVSPLLLALEFFCIVIVQKKKDRLWVILPLMFSLAGLMINVCAPGNLLRGGEDLFQKSAIHAIIAAITQATYFIKAYYKRTMLVFLIYFLLVVWEAMGHIRTEFRFSYPLLFLLVSYGVYCALWTPVTYSGVATYARLGNQLFLGQMTLLSCNAVYLSGWFQKNVVKGRYAAIQRWAVYVSLLALVVYFSKNSYLYPSEQARVQVESGNARQFDEQMDERFSMYYDDSVKEVYVKPLEYVPGLFFIQDSSFDSLVEYFHKDFIKYEGE